MQILPSKTHYTRLSGWIFVAVWLFGACCIIAGLEVADGFWENFAAICIFGGACAAWWGAYKLSNFTSSGGFVVIGLWMLEGPLGALLEFRHYVASPFFWASSGMLLLLVILAAISQPRAERSK